jgi:hypothetical protein
LKMQSRRVGLFPDCLRPVFRSFQHFPEDLAKEETKGEA